jgi:hypothetical protein
MGRAARVVGSLPWAGKQTLDDLRRSRGWPTSSAYNAFVMAGPKPDSLRLTNLISDLDEGILKIPAFQRNLVWDMDKALLLLDSLAKEYPIGSFLLWESDDYLHSLRNVGNIELPDVPEGRLVSYILDGQQRITSLYAAAKAAKVTLADESEREYRVWVDLDATGGEGSPIFLDIWSGPSTIPFDALVGDSPHLVTKALDDKRHRRFTVLRDAFRTYDFSVIRVRQKTLDIVCDIFERINNLGTPLSLFDLVAAKTWSENFDLRVALEAALDGLRASRYDQLPASIFIQTASALQRGSVRREDVLKLSRQEMPAVWEQTERFLELAIDLVRTAVGVPVAQMLPYPAVLVAYAYFFSKIGGSRPSALQAARLKSYFWRVGVSRRYTGASETLLNQDLRLMAEIAEDKEVIWQFGTNVSPNQLLETPLSGSNAFAKTLICLLAIRRPRNFTNSEIVVIDGAHLSRSNSRHYHHFFPKGHLRGHPAEELANSIANITLVPADENLHWSDKPPIQYLSEIEKHKNPRVFEMLPSHYIGASEISAIRADNFEAFLTKRAKKMAQALNHLL